ncbi:xanthine dehydrogenase family protein molybdopterin-binding subunit [Chloroflexota bacterium]
MAQEYSVVGRRLPRWAARDKATGSAGYTVDIKLPGLLVGKVLASPHPHALIKKIDKSGAEKLPGVAAVISFEDIPQKLYNPNKLGLTLVHPKNEVRDMYVLTEKARYAREPVAAVAAIDEATAEQALDLIKVEYEALPAVFDPYEAMKLGAPMVHDFAKNNIALHLKFPVAWGDVEQGFKEADVIVEETFPTASNHICQMEPCACVADYRPDGRITVWSPSQHIFLHRRKLAELFDLPIGMVRWITPHVGGAFGKYGSFGVEPVCVALAMKAGKPVKLAFSREEDLLCTETRQRFIITGKLGFKKDGTLTAVQEKMIVDGGSYFTHNNSTSGVNMGAFLGLYRCPNVAAEADCVYTNVPPTGGIRGYGNHEANLALEQLMDIAAQKLDMDPIELRLKNIKYTGDPSSTGLPMETCTFKECIELGSERIGWRQKKSDRQNVGSKRYGIGMAIEMDVSGAHPFNTQHRNVYIKFNEDGSANLIVGGADIGQNLSGTISQIAAEVLGIAYEDIHIVPPDTDVSMFDQGQHASGGCYQTGNAVIIAAKEAKKQILERAGKKLGVTAEEMDISNRRVYVKTDPQKGISVAEISKEAIYNFNGEHLNISAKGSFSPVPNPPPIAVVFAEVEVDIETGVVKPLNILYVADSGRVINPATLEGQLEGGIAQSVGLVLSEDYVVNKKNGVLESTNFNTYRLPTILDLPKMEVVLYEEQPVPSGPFGAKGGAQGAMVAVTPAIANAIYDAIGVSIKDMPITPEKILKAIKAK